MRDRNQINKKGPEPKLKPLQGLHPHPPDHDRNLGRGEPLRGRVPPRFEFRLCGHPSSFSPWLGEVVTDVAEAWSPNL